MSQVNFKSPFNEMIKLWIESKELAIKTNNFNNYNSLLKESVRSLSIIYAGGKKEWFLLKVGSLIKVATRELSENMINQRYHSN